MRSILLTAVLAFAAGGLTFWVIWGEAGSPGGGAETSSVVPTSLGENVRGAEHQPERSDLKLAVQRIDERLGRIEGQLSGLAASGPDGRAPVAAGPDLAGELTRLNATVEQLALEIESGFEEVQERSSELHTLKLAKPEPDWHALEALISEWQRDEDSATEHVRLMSPTDIVRSYGTPTEMWGNEHGNHWVYGEGQDAVTGEYLKEVYLKFQDGYVAYVGVALR